MCIAIFSLEHPVYSVVLCSNRDEFLHRPTLPAQFHSFEHAASDALSRPRGEVLSGRDVVAGGTWLGVNRKGRIAVLTNITEPLGQYSTSRGELPTAFLLPPDEAFESLDAYVEHLTTPPFKSYAGFNLLLMAPASAGPGSLEAARVTNSGGGGRITARPLREDERQFGAMSNGIDGLPGGEWPKVIEGRARLQSVLDQGLPEEALIPALFDALNYCPLPPQTRQQLRTSIIIPPLLLPTAAPQPPPGNDGPLPEAPITPSTGKWYGTRLSTVVLVKKTGEVVFVERDIWKLGVDGQPIRVGTDADRITTFQLDVKL